MSKLDDHFAKLDEMILAGKTIIRHDEPRKLRHGFMVEETEGSFRSFQYRVSEFKVRRDSRVPFIVEDYQTEEVRQLVTNLNDIILNSEDSATQLMSTYRRIRGELDD